ncbi:interleukin-10 receptor subunit beta isoform X2 [Xyrichtys novacula]|uniref:Interleukin-10 receptor subunit beta isoform X2 n=1 Tax=Xyrichtys novacula TaxID=13765 RepID=A0AAV1GYY5_XYRNO|nr:interleukin-10 receptor subunit beta isoform X2 [Xyrichtys novacula]
MAEERHDAVGRFLFPYVMSGRFCSVVTKAALIETCRTIPSNERLRVRYLSTTFTMSASVWICLLICTLTVTAAAAAAAEPAPPQDISILTLNTNYTLTWNWNQNHADTSNVTFTTQYIPAYKLDWGRKDWYEACEDSPHKSCDLTKFNLYYKTIYTLRVRTNVNGRHSEWIQSEFCPETDADVGPPSKVELSPAGSDLDVNITDPLTSNNTSMREHLSDLQYKILYWEHSEDAQVLKHHEVVSSANLVTLPSLKSWTWYCVMVQTRGDDYYNKSSRFTPPLCKQTEGPLPWWQILLYFLASLLVFFVLVVVFFLGSFWCYRTVKATLFPSIQLPTHFKEYLCDSPGSDIPRLLTPDPEDELLCAKVTVCPGTPVLEVHQPPFEELEELDIRHSRQNSSGSTDSGVYSTEGGSSQRPQPSSCEGSGASIQSTFDPVQVKMRDITPKIRGQLEVTDEGVVDVSV